jgi:hypothetical protein
MSNSVQINSYYITECYIHFISNEIASLMDEPLLFMDEFKELLAV